MPRARRFPNPAKEPQIDGALVSPEPGRRHQLAAADLQSRDRAVLRERLAGIQRLLHLRPEREAGGLGRQSARYRSRPGTVVDILRHNSNAKWFVVVPVGGPDLPGVSGETASPSSPEFVLLSDGPVGELYANDLLEKGTKRVKLVDGKPLLVDGRPVFVPVQVFESNITVRPVADACLYFGKALPELVQPPAALYNGTGYGREVQRRRAIMSGLH